MEGGNPEIQIELNRQRVAQLGTDIQTIAKLIRNEIQGDVATQLNRRDRKVDIRVRSREKDRETVEALKRLIVNPGSSVPVPLFSVASISVERGPSEIRRVDQERVAVVSANVEGRDLGSAVSELRQSLARIEVPPEMSLTIAGQNAEMAVSFASMRFAIFLAIFLVYLVMASQFESLLHPFVIMFTIPFGLIGVFFTLWIFGQTISVVSLIGMIMLAGIVVNNAIVLVDYINHLRRVEKMPKIEAIVQAGQVRLRPILMTATTTILGLLPMSLGIGEGSEVRAPMAITVIGGLLVATVLTLVFIPTIYSLFEKSN
jgi:HAE1 family hydrophobic/amphiphilic exporter-1